MKYPVAVKSIFRLLNMKNLMVPLYLEIFLSVKTAFLKLFMRPGPGSLILQPVTTTRNKLFFGKVENLE